MTQTDDRLIDDWIEKYKPIANPFTNDSGFVINGKSIMFETYGDDLDFVLKQPKDRVWTWLDGDEGTFIGAGFAFVNRIGYIVTEEPWDSLDQEIQIDNYSDYDEDDDDE